MSAATEHDRTVTIEVLNWAISHIGLEHVRADVLRDVATARDSVPAVAMAAADSIARQLTALRDTYARTSAGYSTAADRYAETGSVDDLAAMADAAGPAPAPLCTCSPYEIFGHLNTRCYAHTGP